MLATYKEYYLSFFVFKVKSVKLRCIYLRLCHIAIAIGRAHSFWQFSLIFSVMKICHQVKNRTNRRWIFNFCKIPRKYQNSAAKGKFHGLARNSAARGKLWALL